MQMSLKISDTYASLYTVDRYDMKTSGKYTRHNQISLHNYRVYVMKMLFVKVDENRSQLL